MRDLTPGAAVAEESKVSPRPHAYESKAQAPLDQPIVRPWLSTPLHRSPHVRHNPMGWPYCQGHRSCHNPHTRQYARPFFGIPNQIGDRFWEGLVISDPPTRDPFWGERLCPAHALILYGVA